MVQKILLVENNHDFRENVRELLEISNYMVFTACNGKEGLEIAQQQIPHLILSAIKMPEMDGLPFAGTYP
ncbi:MAG TPA: response regulator [Hanamia sp.]|nr:response regulator [Hanamia sp.]